MPYIVVPECSTKPTVWPVNKITMPVFRDERRQGNVMLSLYCTDTFSDLIDIQTVQPFHEDGATLSIAANTPNAAACMAMIGTVFQLLSEVLFALS